MPSGIPGSVTYVKKLCANSECGKLFKRRKALKKICCSKECANILRAKFIKFNKKVSIDKIVRKTNKQLKNEREAKNLHLKTIFVGGYDGSTEFGNDLAVLCNEGEIL